MIGHRGLYWWPLPDSRSSPDIPSGIGGAFSEAVTAAAAGCPRAAAAMARRTLEAICEDQGETTGTLQQRIAALKTAGKLHETLSDWATEVRLVGNVGAHFDPIKDVSLDEAKALCAFVQELLKFIYEMPAQLRRRRAIDTSSRVGSEASIAFT